MDQIIESLVEIRLKKQDDFLKICETLTRIGVPLYREKKLFQSCHLLHKRGKYYIVHFKELFLLDGKPANNFDDVDIGRRNLIVYMLEKWGLVEVVDLLKIKNRIPSNLVKVIRHSEKEEWQLCSKYTVGGRKYEARDQNSYPIPRRTFTD